MCLQRGCPAVDGQGGLKSVHELRIMVLMDNYYDGLLPSTTYAHRRGLSSEGTGIAPLPPPLRAEHGLSYYVEVARGRERHALLCDFGASPDGVARNLEALSLDLSGAEALVLSHGHFDHYLGLGQVVSRHLPATRRPLPLYLGKEAFARRFMVPPKGRTVDLGRLSPEEVANLGLEVRQVDRPAEILPGVLVTGEIPRETPFEQGAPVLQIERDGQLVADRFPGELSLVFHVENRGLVVLSSCAHAGIVNTVRWARQLTGTGGVLAIIGGFHLSGAPAEKVARTVEALREFGPEVIVPMHCTGFQATTAIAEGFPGAFTLNSVGTEYRFTGA